jgi:hypothetical protein
MVKYWVKHTARFLLWIIGLFFAIMGVLGQIPVLPQYALQMVIALYIFMIASLVVFISGLEKPPAKR